jgi:Tol biopolymer transport system component
MEDLAMTRHAWIWAAATALCAALMLPAQKADSAESLLQAATKKELVDGNLKAAIEGYRKALAAAGSNRAVAAKALLRLGECYEKQGNAEARQAYERLVKEYSDQKEQARDAGARLAAMGQPAGGSQSMVAQLIAEGSDMGFYGRVTPDGRLYAFIDPATGDIAVRDLRTGAIKRLTNEGNGVNPIPSRDGKQIAYSSYLKDGVSELRVINVDGSGRRTVPVKLKNSPYFKVRVWDWSTDGKSVLMTGMQQDWWGIATIDLASGEVHRLSSRIPLSEMDVAGFSPDGRWIVHSRRLGVDNLDWDIIAIDTQTGHEAIVVTGAGADREPMWVPDSDKIVFRSDRNGKNAIWMVRFKDGQAGAPVLIKPDAGDYTAKGMSRDGSLFYSLWHGTTDVYQATVAAETLRVQDTPTRVLATYRGENSAPSWSPSGDSFAYLSRRDNTSRLVVHHPDGKETVMAEPARYSGYPPHWCGDGDRLTTWGTPTPLQMQLFDPRTGNASPVEPIKWQFKGSYQVMFSPDCKSAYVSTRVFPAGPRLIFRYDFSTGKETELLTDAGEWATAPRVSPDGRWLALHGNLPGGKASGVLLLSTAGGPLRMLAPGGRGHGWSPDSKRVMYARSNELYWVSVEGGTPQSMGIRMPGATAPSLNADGKRILFSATERSNELWVLRDLPLK